MAEGALRAASTTCVVGGVAAGGPPAAEGRPRAAGTACAVCAGTPPVAEGRPPAVVTACGGLVSAGMPPAADCPQTTSPMPIPSTPSVFTPLVGTAVVETQGTAAPCAVHASSSLDEVWAALPDLATVDKELDDWGIPGVGRTPRQREERWVRFKAIEWGMAPTHEWPRLRQDLLRFEDGIACG